MSTDPISDKIDELGERRSKLIEHLPLWKRFKKRYLTGDAFVSWNLSTLATWPSAFPAGVAAAASWPLFAAKFPFLAGLLVKVWAALTSFVTGLFTFGG